MEEIHYQRLLNAARGVRESAHPEFFTMVQFTCTDLRRAPCGTPACVLGHYGARRDLQQVLSIDSGGDLVADGGGVYGAAQDHFGLTTPEVIQLFYTDGCGGAQTPEEAATYIERFVEQRRAETT